MDGNKKKREWWCRTSLVCVKLCCGEDSFICVLSMYGQHMPEDVWVDANVPSFDCDGLCVDSILELSLIHI